MLVGLLLVLLSVVSACGPSRPPANQSHFVTVVHNTTPADEDVTIRWATAGTYHGEAKRKIAPWSYAVVVMGVHAPDLVEIESLALNTGYGPPEWGAGRVFHVSYPSGASWADH